MRVLRLAPYVYIENIYFRNKTGFGKSVWAISRWQAKENIDTYVFTYQLTDEKRVEEVTFLEHKLLKVIKHINLRTFKSNIGILKKSHINYKNKIRLLRYYATEGYVKYIINRIKPDIIHIHGMGLVTLPYINASVGLGYPVILTLHGLNYFDANSSLNKFQKEIEKETIQLLNRHNIPITMVGTGVKEEILRNFNVKYPELLIPIVNGVDEDLFNNNLDKGYIKRKNNIDENYKVILSVGSLTKNKNQRMLIDALKLLSVKNRNNIKCFIIGDGPEKDNLQYMIDMNNLQESIILTGYKTVEQLGEYYCMADLLVSTSLKEGFGRPFLEAFLNGIPVLTFADLYAVKDIYNPQCMYIVNERTANNLSRGIHDSIDKTWDKAVIKAWAKQFTWENVIQSYIKVYSRFCKNTIKTNNLIEEINNLFL